MTDTAPYIVVGAGQAGHWAVRTLREEGYDGPLVLIGDEQHPPYERPPLSKQVMAGDATPESCYLTTADKLAELGVEFIPGRGVETLDRDRRLVALDDGTVRHYHRLMITTGTRPRPLDVPGAEAAPLHYLRTIEDSLAIRAHFAPGRHVAIIGGGLIGLEAAATAIKAGCRVSVIEAADRLMARVVGTEASAHFATLHRSHGVDIIFSAMATEIESGDKACRISLSTGTQLEADVIVAGIGVVANAEFAARAGLKTDNGVWVDEYGRSEDPHIFAAGDVTCHHNPYLDRRVRLETWQNAQNQAIAAAKTMAGTPTAANDVPWGWSDQFDARLQILGVPERWDRMVRRDGANETAFSLFYLDGDQLTAVNAINTPMDIAVARRLMGRRMAVDAERLADTSVALRDLLKG